VSLNRKLATLRRYFAFLKSEGYLGQQNNPAWPPAFWQEAQTNTGVFEPGGSRTDA